MHTYIYTNKVILQESCTRCRGVFFAFGFGDEHCFWLQNPGASQFPGAQFSIHGARTPVTCSHPREGVLATRGTRV